MGPKLGNRNGENRKPKTEKGNGWRLDEASLSQVDSLKEPGFHHSTVALAAFVTNHRLLLLTRRVRKNQKSLTPRQTRGKKVTPAKGDQIWSIYLFVEEAAAVVIIGGHVEVRRVS